MVTRLLRPRPVCWAEVANCWHRLPSITSPIRGIEKYRVAPPVWKGVSRIAHGKEDNDARERGPKIHGSCKDIVVLGPPRKEFILDPVVEDEIYQSPRGVIDA